MCPVAEGQRPRLRPIKARAGSVTHQTGLTVNQDERLSFTTIMGMTVQRYVTD